MVPSYFFWLEPYKLGCSRENHIVRRYDILFLAFFFLESHNDIIYGATTRNLAAAKSSRYGIVFAVFSKSVSGCTRHGSRLRFLYQRSQKKHITRSKGKLARLFVYSVHQPAQNQGREQRKDILQPYNQNLTSWGLKWTNFILSVVHLFLKKGEKVHFSKRHIILCWQCGWRASYVEWKFSYFPLFFCSQTRQ